ncbi:MAG: hypothetical protein HYR71_02445, partial [Chloroflexi bacterium]|nr:hypothetical protein [Chloroflexota bacterium]
MTTRKLLTRRTLFIALPLLFAALALGALAAIQNTPAYTDAASPDWSRGALIGSASLVNPIALAPEPQGGTSLVWVDSDAERNQRLHYARLNAAGEVVVSQPLALPQPRPETPTLFRMDDGTFQLFYLAPPPDIG